jgi:hypothetical protein
VQGRYRLQFRNAPTGWEAHREFRQQPAPTIIRTHGNYKHGRYCQERISRHAAGSSVRADHPRNGRPSLGRGPSAPVPPGWSVNRALRRLLRSRGQPRLRSLPMGRRHERTSTASPGFQQVMIELRRIALLVRSVERASRTRCHHAAHPGDARTGGGRLKYCAGSPCARTVAPIPSSRPSASPQSQPALLVSKLSPRVGIPCQNRRLCSGGLGSGGPPPDGGQLCGIAAVSACWWNATVTSAPTWPTANSVWS